MEKITFKYKSIDGQEIFVHKWIPAEKDRIKGIVQVAHGMAEHGARYNQFAEFLTRNNYIVYVNDHRGHGQTAAQDKLGFFAESDGWNLVLEDISHLTLLIKEEHDNYPLYLFGHSMGSLLVRDYISIYSPELEGAIISATMGDQGVLGEVGIIIAKLESKLRGTEAKSKLLDKLTFANCNKNFKPKRTSFDWLSRDTAEVNKYIEDSLCGWVGTTSFFQELFQAVKRVNRVRTIERISKDLAVYFLAGGDDPLGNDGQGVLAVYNKFREVGIKDVSCEIYPKARHELLKEINREQVFSDILKWLQVH